MQKRGQFCLTIYKCTRQEALKWEVQKIGVAIDDYYEPLILMRDFKYSQDTKKT